MWGLNILRKLSKKGIVFPMSLALALLLAGALPNIEILGHRVAEESISPTDTRFADFSSRTLDATSFKGANLLMADFRMSTLRRVDFTGADLKWTNFVGSEICGSIMPDGYRCDLNCSGTEAFQPATPSTCPYLAEDLAR
ncbi:pentapeptide repeat-containing protein [Aliirhizobium smilacinae]|uniref:Pentapeptide repeat-containing protein n=1 Tax=Aliirhizobium smilacinae TaxID=1395944 RepID=A0A5C4X941_9HYPH|nr:hypothetical protein FHP24_27425 [Rhizobium smilacinae]